MYSMKIILYSNGLKQLWCAKGLNESIYHARILAFGLHLITGLRRFHYEVMNEAYIKRDFTSDIILMVKRCLLNCYILVPSIFVLNSGNVTARLGYEPIAQFESSQTPPDYLVHETRDGRLLNDSGEVEWPRRPQFGRYAERSDENIVPPYSKQSSKHYHRQHSSKDEIGMDKVCRQKTEGPVKSTRHDYLTDKAKIDEAIKIDEDDSYLFVGE
uniref:Bestrophin homolog n=1 Tax=Elaeophora elaphi TaxID=1147741 RepID=A0A0R3RV72_9BILA